jgi:ADP-ribose pyrophosphatase
MNGSADFGSVKNLLVIQLAQFIRATGDPVTKNEKIHYSGRFLGLKERDRWEYTFRTNASGVVALVPVTDDEELVLVEQYRIPVKSRVMELPAGLVGDTGDPDEDFRIAANRELIEETGYSATHLEELLVGPSTSGLADEILTIYFASGLKKVGPGGGDGNEDIEVHLVPLKNAEVWLATRSAEGILLDPKVYAGLYWAGRRS